MNHDEFEITLKLRNNRMRGRRKELGLSVPRAAEMAGIHFQLWWKYEALRLSPFRHKNAKQVWKVSALSVARVLGLAVDECFPEAVCAVVAPEATRTIKAEELIAFSEFVSATALEEPKSAEQLLVLCQRSSAVVRAREELSPRLRNVVELRFDDDLTLDQVGEHLGVTRERARQLEKKALSELERNLRLRLGTDLLT